LVELGDGEFSNLSNSYIFRLNTWLSLKMMDYNSKLCSFIQKRGLGKKKC